MKKPKKVTVLLEPEIFVRFDAYCEQKGCKKSSLLSRMILDHLDKEQINAPANRTKKTAKI